MNKLIAFGDSFTWGSELSDAIDANLPRYLVREQKRNKYRDKKFPKKNFLDSDVDYWKIPYYSEKTWSALLAKHNNMKYECHATPGNSNSGIFRNLLSEIDTIDDTNVVILNWTWVHRWDFYDLGDDKWETVLPESTSNFSKLYLTYMQSELWDKFESLKTISLAHEILKRNNIKYISTCVDTLLLDNKFHCPRYISLLQNLITADIKWFDSMGFPEWAKNNKFKIGKNGHPLEEAHLKAFEYIVENHDFTK